MRLQMKRKLVIGNQHICGVGCGNGTKRQTTQAQGNEGGSKSLPGPDQEGAPAWVQPGRGGNAIVLQTTIGRQKIEPIKRLLRPTQSDAPCKTKCEAKLPAA